MKNKKLNILFVCRFNRFRSRVAEAYFKKINRNKKIKTKSAGIIAGFPINKFEINQAKKFNINIKGKPQGISSKLLKWQDIIIITASDVSKPIFKNKKYDKKTIVWKIKDTKANDREQSKKIIEKIIKKVDKLNKEIKNGNSKRI